MRSLLLAPFSFTSFTINPHLNESPCRDLTLALRPNGAVVLKHFVTGSSSSGSTYTMGKCLVAVGLLAGTLATCHALGVIDAGTGGRAPACHTVVGHHAQSARPKRPGGIRLSWLGQAETILAADNRIIWTTYVRARAPARWLLLLSY